MKKFCSKAISILLVLSVVLCFAGCSSKIAKTGLWENATYVEDTTLGDGATPITVIISAEEKEVKFTINTDEVSVAAALLEHSLVSGDSGDFGLYIKTANGITADYAVDQSYWAFYIDGEYATRSAELTPITENAVYKFEYTKD